MKGGGRHYPCFPGVSRERNDCLFGKDSQLTRSDKPLVVVQFNFVIGWEQHQAGNSWRCRPIHPLTSLFLSLVILQLLEYWKSGEGANLQQPNQIHRCWINS